MFGCRALSGVYQLVRICFSMAKLNGFRRRAAGSRASGQEFRSSSAKALVSHCLLIVASRCCCVLAINVGPCFHDLSTCGLPNKLELVRVIFLIKETDTALNRRRHSDAG